MADPRHRQEFVDGYIRSANIQSYAKAYATGITWESADRSEIGTYAIQNLDGATDLRLWYGCIPVDPLDLAQGYLPVDPSGWTGPQTTSAETTLATYGEKVGPGQYLEQFIAPSGPLYVYCPAGTVNAHTREG